MFFLWLLFNFLPVVLGVLWLWRNFAVYSGCPTCSKNGIPFLLRKVLVCPNLYCQVTIIATVILMRQPKEIALPPHGPSLWCQVSGGQEDPVHLQGADWRPWISLLVCSEARESCSGSQPQKPAMLPSTFSANALKFGWCLPAGAQNLLYKLLLSAGRLPGELVIGFQWLCYLFKIMEPQKAPRSNQKF